MIFTSLVKFNVLEELENLTPISKYVEIDLPSVADINNLEIHWEMIFCSVVLRPDFAIFG